MISLSFVFLCVVFSDARNVPPRWENETTLAEITQLDRFGSGQRNQSSDECSCGPWTQSCRYENWKKVCECDAWHSQRDGYCTYCYCGALGKSCHFEGISQICDCYPGYTPTSYGSCEECDCGSGSEKCEYSGYSKMCTCRLGYVEHEGSCKLCDCGTQEVSCRFNYFGSRICTCQSGYVATKENSWNEDEKCKPYSETSGWRIATYIEAVFFVIIIISLLITISMKRSNEC